MIMLRLGRSKVIAAASKFGERCRCVQRDYSLGICIGKVYRRGINLELLVQNWQP